MKRLLILGVAALTLVLFASSCVSWREKRLREFTSSPLVGMVYDLDQKPCAGALITVDGQEGPRTDINGRFVIAALRRGEHLIGVSKQGYEPLEAALSFLDRTQVLYLRLTSLGQLLRKAEEALDRRRFQEADDLLRRAEALNAEDPVGMYLRAVYFLKRENTEEAIGLLEKILAQGQKAPAILLSLADIYQYRLQDVPRAIFYLRQFLDAEDNPEVRARLTELESRPTP
jgi:tetratricopeptide (TPR) repeat protein